MGSVMVLNGQFCCFVEAVRLFCNGVRVGSCGFLQCTLAFRLRGVEQNASYSMGSDGLRRGTPCTLGTSVCSSCMQGMLCHRFLVAAVPFTMSILCIAYMERLARVAPVRASGVKEKVGVTIFAGLLESAAMQCHESVTFFIFRDWGIVQCQKIKMRQILSPTCVKT